MAAQFNQYMTWAHEALQDYAIVNIMGMDEIISDLNLKTTDESWLDDLLRSFGAGEYKIFVCVNYTCILITFAKNLKLFRWVTR